MEARQIRDHQRTAMIDRDQHQERILDIAMMKIKKSTRIHAKMYPQSKSISRNLILTRLGPMARPQCATRQPNPSKTLLAMTAVTLMTIASCLASVLAYNDGNYDPEQQDGIPVFSARSVPRPQSSSPDDDWSNGGDSELMSASPNQPLPSQRRQSDGDLDDGLEDEEEDEYKSGSSPHESIESPGYGESRRFAQDGDEIEEFFDRHLGPPREAAIAAESSPPASSQRMDPDDQYAMAASSPLSSIFHSLLGHHDHKHTKRPFLQIATSSDSGESSSEQTAPSKTSSKNLEASQSAQVHSEATPIALAFTPIAAPSTIRVQEQQDSHEAGGHEQDGQAPPGSGVREIYIGRRPTVMSYLQQAHVVPQSHQQAALPGYYTASSANVWRGPNGRPMVYEPEHSADYVRHPAAASQAYQHEQPTGASSAASPVADDEQTVTYGLSFGDGDSGSKDEHAADQEAERPSEETNAETESPETHQGYVPYNTKYTTSSTRAHNNYYNNQYAPVGYVRAYPAAQSGPGQQHYYPRQVMMVQQQPQQHHGYHSSPHYQQQQQQQYAAGATRYHRDPSESANHLAAMRAAHIGIGYAEPGQHRGLGNRNAPISEAYGQQRQRLLANLDREIKASPQYRQNTAAAATAPSNLYARRPQGRNSDKQHLVAIGLIKKSYPSDDLDTFNSFHSEVDPYKTFTKTSRMINGADPFAFLADTRQFALQDESRSHSLPGRSSTQDDPQSTANQEALVSTANDTNANAGPYAAVHADGRGQQQVANNNLLTGPLTNNDSHRSDGDLLRTDRLSARDPEAGKVGRGTVGVLETNTSQGLSRVRRDDSEDREIDDDGDDDGVWVDDDGDDDNKQQSSDVNETSQQPEEEEEDDGQQDAANNVATQPMNPPGLIGAPHSYELSPNDLMIYHG